MLVSIHNNRLRRVGFLDNDKPDATHFYDDTWHRYLAEATSTFDFSVSKSEADPSVLTYLTEQNYVSFRYGGRDYLFNIMKITETEEEITLSCENLNLELVNEIERHHDPSGAKSYIDYINQNQISYAQLKIGINEVSNRKRTLSWDGTESKLARLISIATGFDAEIEFVTHLNRDGTLKEITLNTYIAHDDTHQGVGTRRNDVTLFYRKGLSNVRRTVDKSELYTAIRPIGTDNLTIGSLDKTEKDSAGRVLYRSAKGDEHILAPQAKDMYPAQFANMSADEYINYEWSYDTKDINTLYSKGLAKIKSLSSPAITYEAESTVMLDIGDTITIHDDGFTPTLLLEARVSEQEISFSDPSKNKNTYSNFRALQNRLSSNIQGRLQTIVSSEVPYAANILSDNGTVLRKKTDRTTLTARVTKGDEDVTASQMITWTKDGEAAGTSKSITITGLDGKSVYRFEATDSAGTLLCGAEVTVFYIGDSVQTNIVSSAGNTFKNNATATMLSLEVVVAGRKFVTYAEAAAYFGSSVSVEWRSKSDSDTEFLAIPSNDSRISDNGFKLLLSGIDTRTIFDCTLTY